jgi:hypothetical protein
VAQGWWPGTTTGYAGWHQTYRSRLALFGKVTVGISRDCGRTVAHVPYAVDPWFFEAVIRVDGGESKPAQPCEPWFLDRFELTLACLIAQFVTSRTSPVQRQCWFPHPCEQQPQCPRPVPWYRRCCSGSVGGQLLAPLFPESLGAF